MCIRDRDIIKQEVVAEANTTFTPNKEELLERAEQVGHYIEVPPRLKLY